MALGELEITDPEDGKKLLIRHNGGRIIEWTLADDLIMWTRMKLREDLVELALQAMANRSEGV